MEKKRFLFYTSWKKNIDIMDDVELRRFINNLINYTDGNQIELITKVDKIVWNDAVELLNHNEAKRQKTIERNKKNGQLGGRPPKPTETQNNPVGFNETQNNPTKPEERREIQEERRKKNEDRKEMYVDKLINVMKQLIQEEIVTKEYVEGLDKKEAAEVLNFTLSDIPDWEEKLNKSGYNGFCLYLKDNNIEVDYILSAQIKAYQILQSN